MQVERLNNLKSWVSAVLTDEFQSIDAIPGDASFRRYFRVTTSKNSYILMDAPPEHENCALFAKIADELAKHDIRVPTIVARDYKEGFLLLSDFGDQQLLSALRSGSADALYQQAIDALLVWQSVNLGNHCDTPIFDARFYRYEFDLFIDWFLKKHGQLDISDKIKQQLDSLLSVLIESGNDQPVTLVHRDYHAKNLMVCSDGALGILDFQDMVKGPITYDLVSLLRDCYVDWSRDKVVAWARYYYDHADEGQIKNTSFSVFLRWFDLMGLQRHLKCLGIFSRLAYRDSKKSYLQFIPRVINYIVDVSKEYSELAWLDALLKRVDQ